MHKKKPYFTNSFSDCWSDTFIDIRFPSLLDFKKKKLKFTSPSINSSKNKKHVDIAK